MRISRRSVLILGVGTVAALAALEETLHEGVDTSTSEPVVPGAAFDHPVPPGAVWVAPTGRDGNPGTQASPRATLTPGAVNVLTGGTYYGYSQRLPPDTVTTAIVPRGQTAVFDGQGRVKSALECAGVTNLYGDLRVTSYVPASQNVGANAPIYFGGTAAGSEIDGLLVSDSAMAGLGFQVPLVLTKLTVDSCGYSGILGTTADGTTFGRVRVMRTNRDHYMPDGQLGAVKITRSADLYFGPDVYVEDTGGAIGIWTDVSCRRPRIVGSQVRTGFGTPAQVGLQIEETEGGVVVDTDIEGVYAANIVASGHLHLWDNRFTGSSVALQVRQDRPRNSGTNPANLDPAEAPWWTVGLTVSNNLLTATTGAQVAPAVYSDPGYGLAATDMLASLKGNTLIGTVDLGDASGNRDDYGEEQLAAHLGAVFDPNRQPMPPEVAGLLHAAQTSTGPPSSASG
ncbi:MAG: hypothetical protein JOZ82_07500 [Marmoricola sp.]|nr:hypothetical protein [Marmoricola sp.]